MSRRAVEIRVGGLLIAASVLLFLGYTWYSGYRVGKSGYNLSVHFSDVTGLQSGDDVRVAGVKKGKVGSIALQDSVVLVTVWLDNDVRLFEDATFAIMDVALISGTKYIAVIPGTSATPLDLSRPAHGMPSASFALNSIAGLSESLQEVVRALKKDLLTEDALRNTREALENLNIMASQWTGVIEENRADFKAGVKTLRSASARLDSVLGSEEFSRTIARLDTLTQKMTSGDGTIARLLNDPEAYDEMRSTLKATRELLEDIRAHPRKYINLELF